MSIESIAEGLSSKLDILKLEYRTCVNYLSPKGKCKNCLDICPVDGIDIENGINFTSNCTRCGVCSTLCPTSSIFVNSPTENYIYNKVKKISEDPSKDIVINCFESYKEDKNIINIPCVGVLSLELILYLSYIENNVQIIVGNKCKNCSKSFGYKSYVKKFNESNIILNKVNIKPNEIKNSEIIPDKINSLKLSSEEINSERRAFLKSIFLGIKNIPKKTIKNIIGEDIEEKPIKVNNNYKYKILEKIFVNVKSNKDMRLNIRTYPSFENPCYFCKACIKMCPKNALTIKNKNITLNKKECNGCGLCEDVCFYKSIRMRGDFISDYTFNQIDTIEGKEIRCKTCNRTVTTQKGDKCNRCS